MLTWLKMILKSTICKHIQRRVFWILNLSQDLSGCDPVLCACSVASVFRLFETLRTVACQAPLSMGLSQQEYWSGLSFPPPQDFFNPGIEPAAPALAGRFFTTESAGKPVWVLNPRQTHCSLFPDTCWVPALAPLVLALLPSRMRMPVLRDGRVHA